MSSGNDNREVTFDLLAQIPEHGNPASLYPSHSLGKSVGNLVRSGFERQTKILFEQIGTIEFGVGLAQKLQLSSLIF